MNINPLDLERDPLEDPLLGEPSFPAPEPTDERIKGEPDDSEISSDPDEPR